MSRIGVYAGSFDPFTYGHLDIVNQALPLFDEVHVVVGMNPDKKSMFPVEERLRQMQYALCEEVFNQQTVFVGTFAGLLVDYCKDVGATAIVRGLRDHIDFAYESHLAALNLELGGFRTVWFYPSPSVAHVSSSLVRELLRHGRDPVRYTPVPLTQKSEET